MEHGISRIKKTDLKTMVRQSLTDYIRQMDLEKSNKLPREEELCSLLGVSRITLRSVLEELSAEGVILRRQGRGTFVNMHSMDIKVSFNPVIHFSDMIRNSGYTPSTKSLYYGFENAGKAEARMLGIEPGAKVLVWEKVFYADRKICAYTRDYIPAGFISDESMKLINNYEDSLFLFLSEQCNIQVVSDRVEIDVVETRDIPALKARLEREHMVQKPYLLLRGINYDEDENRIMYAQEYVDTGIIKFSQIRKRSFLS